ncbi:molecular chaperone GroES [Candidatus Saccharibacteria bacterium]|jgi:chaperonin GroES|nr:molecular chaperone GroES [Candidatus Saccharibacteria bacterium]
MKIHPLADRIVLEQLQQEEQTKSGIILPDSAQEKPKMAKVLAVGTEVKEVKEGDVVLYKSYGPDDVKVDGQEYMIAKEEDILATVKEGK